MFSVRLVDRRRMISRAFQETSAPAATSNVHSTCRLPPASVRNPSAASATAIADGTRGASALKMNVGWPALHGPTFGDALHCRHRLRFGLSSRHAPADQPFPRLLDVDVVNRRDVERQELRDEQAADNRKAKRTA